ncbi:MAG: hypothetical protein U1E65_09375 [Myxococcota bacterium]
MSRIERRDFSDLARSYSIDSARPTEAVQTALADIGIPAEDLRAIAGDDHVINGAEEFGRLYDRLEELDRNRPVTVDGGRLDRAERLYQALCRAEAPASPAADRGTGGSPVGIGASGRRRSSLDDDEPVRSDDAAPRSDAAPVQGSDAPVGAAPADAAPADAAAGADPNAPALESRDHGTTRVGTGRDARDVATHVMIDPTIQPALTDLRQYSVASPGGGAQGRSLDQYMATLDGMDRTPSADARRRTRAPEGAPAELWNLTAALDAQHLTADDVRTYAATGQLPDLLGADGAVVQSGQDRMQALYTAATQRGEWTAVNSLTFLVGAQRAVMSAERREAEARLATMPAGAERDALSAEITQSRDADREMSRGLQSIYAAATAARERRSAGLISEASRLDTQAAAARDSGNTRSADQLAARAQQLRDQGARGAYAEATYRASMPRSGYSATSTYALAAGAQVDTGNAQVQALQRGGTLPQDPPAALGDAQDAGNGVPGAGRILREAQAGNLSATDRRTLASIDAQRQGGIAAFHRIHLDRGGYFRPVDSTTGAAPARSDALLGHRTAYLEARASQADALGTVVDSYGPTATMSGSDAVGALQASSQRRQILDELGGALAQSQASSRTLDDATTQRDALRTGAADARGSLPESQTALTDAEAGVTRADDANQAVFDLRTSAEARRDGDAVSDSRTIRDGEQTRIDFQTRRAQALDDSATRLDGVVGRLTTQSARDRQDADLVATVLEGHPSLTPGVTACGAPPTQVYQGLRQTADAEAQRALGLIQRADADPPRAAADRQRFQTTVAAARIDLAQYQTQAAELDTLALGDAGRTGATARLDTAGQLLDGADRARTALPVGSEDRTRLATATVDARAGLAEANADYRNGVSRDQLATAERVMNTDLTGDAAATARGRIGSAAVTSLLRHDARFDQVVASGGYNAQADDALYAQARRMLTQGNAQGPQVSSARASLRQIDENLDAVSSILSTSGTQFQNGADYATARTRDLGRSEITAAQAQVSTVISGGTYLLTLGNVDMKEDMAEAGEGATRNRTGFIQSEARRLTSGATELGNAYDQARTGGQAFEFLGAMRIFSDRGNRERIPGAYQSAFAFLDGQVASANPSVSAADRQWQGFNQTAIRSRRVDGVDQPGASPLARSLAGPMMGLQQSLDAYGDRRLGIVTSGMGDQIQSQGQSLQETTRGMGWIIAINTGLEVALGIVATGGFGSAAAVGEAGEALNAGRTAVQGMNAARTAMTVSRTAQVIHTIGVGALYGVGMMGASWGARRLFGEHSGAARGVDVLANFIPIGATTRAAGVVSQGERAAFGAERTLAQTERGLAGIRGAVTTERLLAHARFYGPQIALGGGQAFVTSLAVPALSDRLGIRSELGQAALGLALNTVMSGGIAAIASGRGGLARAQAEALSPHLTEGVPRESAALVRGDLESFLRSTEGRVPTQAEIGAARAQILERMGIPAEGGDAAAVARRERVDATLEAVRIDRVGATVVTDIHGSSREPLNTTEATQAVERIADRLYNERGGDAGGASRTQAYRDALEAVGARVEDGPASADVRRAVADRVRAGEITASFATAPEAGGTAVIANPEQRARVERILADELGGMRRSVESGEGPALTDATGGPSAYQRLSTRLQREGGLSREGAESVLRAVQQDVVERGGVSRVLEAQANATGPLTDAQIQGILAEAGQQAGMPATEARGAAGDLTARGGFTDWVRSQLPASRWTPEMHRSNFLATASPAVQAEMGQLNAAELNAIYGGSPIPRGLALVGDVPGFAAFARANPAEARILADGAMLFPDVRRYLGDMVNANGAAGFHAAAQGVEPMLPRITPHPTNPNYVIVTRGPRSPDFIPAYNVRPRLEADHNGAFQNSARVPGRVSGTRFVPTDVPDLRLVPQPSQMVVNGAPLPNADRVLVFSGHGFWYSAGEGTGTAATMAVEQIRAARQSGTAIDYVVLDACHQRDRRWFVGGSNAEAFQRQVNAALVAAGEPPITVLAADRGGATYGVSQRTYLPFHRDPAGSATPGRLRLGYGYDPARYTPASDGARFYVPPEIAWSLGGSALAIGGAAAAPFIYRAVTQPQQQPQPQPQPQDDSTRRRPRPQP